MPTIYKPPPLIAVAINPQGTYKDCDSCVSANYAWAAESCMESCSMIADAPCSTNVETCDQMRKDEEEALKCKNSQTCLTCMDAGPTCVYDVKKHLCYSTNGIWFAQEIVGVARDKSMCPLFPGVFPPCDCPVGRRFLMIDPDGLACELSGFKLVSATSAYTCPDGSQKSCSGPGWTCQNAEGKTMPTVDKPIQAIQYTYPNENDMVDAIEPVMQCGWFWPYCRLLNQPCDWTNMCQFGLQCMGGICQENAWWTWYMMDEILSSPQRVQKRPISFTRPERQITPVYPQRQFFGYGGR